MNRTKGAARRGNRTGRPLYPSGTKMRKIQITLSDLDYKFVVALGGGYAGTGLRRLVQLHAIGSLLQ